MTTIIKARNDGQYPLILSNGGPRIFYFSDWFDPAVLSDMEQRYGKPDIVVGDVEGTVNDIGYPFYFVPSLQMGLLNFAAKPLMHQRYDDVLQTDFCFCWSINRKHIDRHIMIKLIEFFDLGPYNFTWSGVDKRMDMQPVIDEMDQSTFPWLTPELLNHLLAPINH